MRPLVGIELDDASHRRARRQRRDRFVDEVFAAAGLPLQRFRPAIDGLSWGAAAYLVTVPDSDDPRENRDRAMVSGGLIIRNNHLAVGADLAGSGVSGSVGGVCVGGRAARSAIMPQVRQGDGSAHRGAQGSAFRGAVLGLSRFSTVLWRAGDGRRSRPRQPPRRREGAWLVLRRLGSEAATTEVEAWAGGLTLSGASRWARGARRSLWRGRSASPAVAGRGWRMRAFGCAAWTHQGSCRGCEDALGNRVPGGSWVGCLHDSRGQRLKLGRNGVQ